MYAMILSLAMLTLHPICCPCPSSCCCDFFDCDCCVSIGDVCKVGCPCDTAFVKHQAVPPEPKKTDAPKTAALKAPNEYSFTKTPRGGILLRADGSIEVIFDYGRAVQQQDIDDWFAGKGQGSYVPPGIPPGAGPYYGAPFGSAAGGCANGSCVAPTSSRRGFFRRP